MRPPKPPFRRLRLISAHRRAPASDRALATLLAGIAGAANAGGFILLGSYTSHMTGYLSQIADNLVLWNIGLVMQSMAAIGCFVLGAAASAFAINWGRQFRPQRQYSLPIGVQGGMFVALASIGAAPMEPVTAQFWGLLLLCFIMGFQNATITKISQARIRTTHATGMITDVGIELGRAAYGRSVNKAIAADRVKLLVLLQLLGSFLLGGILGALGYGLIGFGFSLPLAAVLLVLACA